MRAPVGEPVTPAPQPPSAEASGKFVIGLLLGLVGSCLIGSMIGAPVAYFIGKSLARSGPNKGWYLRPVVVYATDVQAGTVLTFDQISQRSIPERWFDESIVTPDKASYVINVPVRASFSAGAPVRWSDHLPKGAEHCFASAADAGR